MAIQPHLGQIVAADSSQGMLDVLEQKVQSRGIDAISTRLIDLTVRDCLEGKFDLVFSSMTMHHVCDVAALITTFVRALKPGGWLWQTLRLRTAVSTKIRPVSATMALSVASFKHY